MDHAPLLDRLGQRLGRRPARLSPLSGGCVGEVYRADFDTGEPVVVKVDRGRRPRLDVEAYMLRLLGERSRLPVPRVLGDDPDLLVMEHIAHDGARSPGGEGRAAEMLAGLHAIRGPAFGLDRDTLIGSLDQPNGWAGSWVSFFAEHRLLAMGRLAAEAGRLDRAALARIERLAGVLDRHLDEPEHPSLVHGDVWAGNVLWHAGEVVGFIDPALSYADAEVELAFIALFGCFGKPFWDRYAEIRPLRPGFLEVRRDLYNVYPLLVHARLFGGGYGADADRIVRRLLG